MRWTQVPLGPLQTNAYVLRNEQKECIIFDPGQEAKRFISYLEKRELKPLAILLTHAHFDHIGAVDEVRDYYKIPAYIHHEENEWLSDPELNGSYIFMRDRSITARPADVLIQGESELIIGSFTFTVLETPGHSPGSVSYYCKEVQAVFSGDALFQMSIGRTDLPGGSMPELLLSIEEKLLSLPDETTVLSGHGPETSIAFEKANNPFLR